ncbi:DUF669 domain-containing protein [Bacillus thuringiensis]|uniref:DUF669 domain-containing protein n=5 Tax=Bacillus cereus group TaxID=86661 RepID=A0AB35PAH5_BACTU|nr:MULTISPECIES: DUF669 domain-containing protein [Bacillus]MED1155385.1 DUF669 domain-containing protein [Bacillus paranthracis]AFQ28149.1 hypothetical protein BTF1_19900 [Bacillus thuringiensis HD-789]AJH06545.1 hypothetical protein AS86_5232 [Bacillus thuringiensis HD1002]AND26191.1 hypothetical protein ATN07_22230 [Bacillus thuringiensis serovar israelensis]EEM99672.1 hypothetical protein bthur0014_56700 [Bacillus thuringiensis IBL 4222]
MAEKKFNWSKFDKKVDLEALAADVQEVEENGGGGDFEKVPDGQYEVAVEKMELTESKKGDPMLMIWFNIVDGEFEGQKIFYYKVMQPQNDKAWGYQVHQNNEMLRKLWDCKEEDVKFTSFGEYADLILDIHEDIDGKFEYLLEKETDKKGYDQFKIVEVFEVE